MIEALGVSLPGGLAERIEVVRGLIVQKRTELQEIEGARLRAVAILAELALFNSESGRAEVTAAVVAVENAARASELAQQNLSNAILLDAAEREGDEYSAHLAALLEHGTAIGLHEGHCPLCDAARTADEFERAVAATRTRLAARGERLAASARAAAQARSAASAASDALILAERKRDELEKRQKSLEDERSASARFTYATTSRGR
jgi:chromosome segregation protein